MSKTEESTCGEGSVYPTGAPALTSVFFCGVRDQSLVSILYRLSFLNHGVASLFATCDMIVSLVSFASLRRHHSTFYSKVLVDLGNSNLD